jgi:hypothetical protein
VDLNPLWPLAGEEGMRCCFGRWDVDAGLLLTPCLNDSRLKAGCGLSYLRGEGLLLAKRVVDC